MKIKNSPNFNERANNATPTMLVLHYTGTRTAEEADAIYMTSDKVAPHYMIDKEGSVTKYVDEGMRAWHAGQSHWDGIADINSASIGIEIVNSGHEFDLEDFSDIQIEKLIDLIKDIRGRCTIPDRYILGHSDISPGRKIDPGEKFPWRKLHEVGIGLMPDTAFAQSIADDKRELVTILKTFGYDYTDDEHVIIEEFCRHYMHDSFRLDVTFENLRMAAVSLLNQKLTHKEI